MKNYRENKTERQIFILGLFTILLLTLNFSGKGQVMAKNDMLQVTYNTVKINGLDIFYREAGDKSKPTILLLHVFPTSSFMFRNLIPQLAGKYHVVAPDYPGFGQSSMPQAAEFNYTFENLTNIVD